LLINTGSSDSFQSYEIESTPAIIRLNSFVKYCKALANTATLRMKHDLILCWTANKYGAGIMQRRNGL